MNKVLVSKGKKQVIDGKERTIRKPSQYYVKNSDFSCNEGYIKLLKTGKVKTNKGKDFFCFDSTFYDEFKQLRRGAQIITPKDVGIILTETGLTKSSTVVEGGSGSGALACRLASFIKQVYSYDIEKENIELAKNNASELKLKNITFKLKDLTKKIDEVDVDAVILDIPNTEAAVKTALKAVKVGGFIVAYTPSIPQVMNFVEEATKQVSLQVIKTIELVERQWKVNGRAVRPISEAIGHTAFLTFVRRVN
ncbi:methyltransferase domain-containing protein [Candidatus Woesearchaeota archaeon]|jgi:tRNA (adenine57-N1/adenine58-N1)-methyltransferase catalytic subunit|nr:methyltransferase domain-containing protein [Candidatus Woesearchaeota archaeon]MBT4368807.1 methyltransferase domain-containing protein [Candidatus Woesearchaeota archaeon]MBT4712096.1 methyltransferase domain-containing protein [Candidatus Woesearchaeota archaeon]MBT6639156.1 methyltransferase domain-containing protein [Candidatus Woesearchaeota archaeon]MBT7134356.1 methyltransferase domain-containing protein [Candidatus Woesearchaeota archaeon]